jgi:hypothetical protein
MSLFNGQDSKLADRLITKHGKNVEEKMLAICSGLDYVNVNLTNIICKDVEEAQVMVISALLNGRAF